MRNTCLNSQDSWPKLIMTSVKLSVLFVYLWWLLTWRCWDEWCEEPEEKKRLFGPWPSSSPKTKEDAAFVAAFVVAVLAVVSTGFLERFRPRWMWRSQYLWPPTTSLEHLHFFPSVLLHLPGSGSIAPLPQYPVCSLVKHVTNNQQKISLKAVIKNVS